MATSLSQQAGRIHLPALVCDSWLDKGGNLPLSGVRLIRIVHQLGAFDFGRFDEQMDFG